MTNTNEAFTSTIPNTGQPSKPPAGQIENELKHMHEIVDILITHIDTLEGKLTPILGQEGPVEVESLDEKANSTIVPLAQKIRDIKEGIMKTTSRVKAIMSRIEI